MVLKESGSRMVYCVLSLFFLNVLIVTGDVRMKDQNTDWRKGYDYAWEK